MALFTVTSSWARENFYKILKKVGEGGENYTIKKYKEPLVRIIREDLAQILQETIGENVWREVHRIFSQNPKITSTTRETIRKLIRPKLR